ncbi:hypothetical protein FRB96_002417 [Tulasnella sp. 330]|nr:hypothetical protein FRB96_002417 [Tulasnella sp. 330]KAG8885585.1 hypothetical protein FRB97_000493 [Tulasnella sp. 331]KAG8889919.1 hypothetical protein FRB98_001965 [Tulasnella sp. 332]
MARFQIHANAKVAQLTDPQVTALTSFLSAPASVVDPMSRFANNALAIGAAGSLAEGRVRLAAPGFIWRGDDGLSPKTMPGMGLGVGQSEMLKRLKERDDKMAENVRKWADRLPPTHSMSPHNPKKLAKPEGTGDFLSKILVENEAKRVLRENIAHHRNVGSYTGRRHAMGYPVRGQRTTSNAKTAKKLNRIDRRG